MKIKLRIEVFASLFVLLPYLENNFTQRYLQWYFAESYIRSITILSFFIMIFVAVRILTIRQHNAYKKIRNLMVVFIVYSVCLIVSTTQWLSAVCSWIWVATPMIFALIVYKYFNSYRFKLNYIIKYAIIWFVLYLSVVVVYYVFAHHLFIDQSVRMSPRAGGAVIFGYTIAVFFILTVIYKNEFRTLPYYLILIILTIGSLGTTTRGSVWLIALFWIANFIFEKLDRKRLIIFIVLLPIFIFLSTIDFSSLETTTFTGIERLFNVHSYRRAISSMNILEVFWQMPLLRKIFGVGPGEFFPYQKWTMFINDVDNNMFSYKGYNILVQPHNSFLYILMEYGILGFVNIGLIFIMGIKQILSNRNSRWIYKLIFVGAVVVLNCLDSVFLVQPGTAYTFWLIILLVIDDDWLKISMGSLENIYYD